MQLLEFGPFFNYHYQCTALRSEMALMRSQLSETALHKDQYLFDLVAAESRMDRLQSKALPTTTYHSPKVDVEQDQEDATEVIKEEEEEVKREKPSSPSVSGLVNWWEFIPCLISCPSSDFSLARSDTKLCTSFC